MYVHEWRRWKTQENKGRKLWSCASILVNAKDMKKSERRTLQANLVLFACMGNRKKNERKTVSNIIPSA